MEERPRPDLDRVRKAMTEHDENVAEDEETPTPEQDETPEDDGEA
jgi:hypothetical protein